MITAPKNQGQQYPCEPFETKTFRYATFGIIVASILMRFWINSPINFWEDEIIAATHANQPFWTLLVNVVRNDIHPPLYFVQLHFWTLICPLPTQFFDAWLKLNSVVWSIFAVFSIMWTSERVYGESVSRLATIFFAVSPVSFYMATELRMYAMLSALIIWAHYFTIRCMANERATISNTVALVAVLIAIVNVHAIGFLFVLLNGLYGLYLARQTRSWSRWLIVYGLAALSALPWLISDLVHDANLNAGKSLAAYVSSLAQSAVGSIALTSSLLLAIGAAFYCMTCAWGISLSRTRALTLIYLVGPILLNILAATFSKPVFKWNFFSTMASPFIAYILALTLAELPLLHRLRVSISVFLVAGLSALAITSRLNARSDQDFRGLANIIRKNYRSGDLVFVPQPSMFWGMAWYLGGPNWGSPLEIAPRPSERWKAIYAKLGNRAVEKLSLQPKSQMLDRNGFRIIVGINSALPKIPAGRIWVISYKRADLVPDFPPQKLNDLPRVWTDDHSRTVLSLYAEEKSDIAL